MNIDRGNCSLGFSDVKIFGASRSQRNCFLCKGVLKEPFIKCDECADVLICPQCFASGRQGGCHSNNHRYRILRDDFPFFEDWKARDEINLIEKLEEFGPNVWTEVARHLNKTPSACEKHYVNNYLEYLAHTALPRPPSPDNIYHPQPITFRCGTNDPPRPLSGTTYHRDLAGYCAARGDFQTELFQSAELDVASIEELPEIDADEEDPLSEALTTAVVEIYNDKLRERCRRKRVIQEHGLINMHRHLAARFRYDATLTHKVCERLSAFAQILKFDEYNQLFEALHAHVELRRRIRQLQKYRHVGLRHFQAAQLYTRLQAQRDKRLKALKQFAANLNSQLPIVADDPSMPPISLVTSNSRPRTAAPLDIIGLPGYDKLETGEKQLCSVSRLVPESYLEFKRLLINECRNRNGIRLAQARTLIKIDVNKTRKIYDFLLEEKLIYPPPS